MKCYNPCFIKFAFVKGTEYEKNTFQHGMATARFLLQILAFNTQHDE